MNKRLIPLLLALSSTSLWAANVQMYGVIDEGLLYQNQKVTAQSSESKFVMNESGFGKMGSRVGIKGHETLTPDLSVSFVLETGYEPDSGMLTPVEKVSDRIFGRESQLSLHTPYGTFAFGRMGNLASANGTYALTLKHASPFGPSFNQVAAMNFFAGAGRYDNMMTYRSPKLWGTTQFYVQHSLETNKTEREDVGNRKRYTGFGASFETGDLNLYMVLDELRFSNKDNPGVKNAHTFSLVSNMKVPFGKFYLSGQYMKDVRAIAFGPNFIQADKNFSLNTKGHEGITGFSILTGVDIPLGQGTLKTGLNWFEGENDGLAKACDLRRWNTGIFYNYPLSKRTALYGGVSHGEQTSDMDTETKVKTTQGLMGLAHRF